MPPGTPGAPRQTRPVVRKSGNPGLRLVPVTGPAGLEHQAVPLEEGDGEPGLGIDCRPHDDGSLRLGVAGELDMDTVGQLGAAVHEALIAHHPTQMIIDLGGVTFLGSSGLRALLTAQRMAGERGAALRIENAQGPVLRVLSLTGLLGILDGHDPCA
jgi:anti-sigma B factor antagonist